MPTAFDKFKNQVLANEEPIKVTGNNNTPQGAAVEKMAQAALQEKEGNDDMTHVTIRMRRSVKRALLKLKADSERTIIDLTEEAFTDLFKKYGQAWDE